MDEQVPEQQLTPPALRGQSLNLLKPLLFFFLLLIVGIGSFWLGKQQSYKVEVPYAPSESPTKVLNPTQQELVKEKEQSSIDNYAWVEFKNPQIKYTLQYPSHWTLSKGEGCAGALKPPDTDNFWICLGVDPDDMQSLADRIKNQLHPKSTENITVGGKPAIRLNNMVSSDKAFTSVFVGNVTYQGAEGFPEEKATLTIDYYHLTEKDRVLYDDVFNKVLSSITFE